MTDSHDALHFELKERDCRHFQLGLLCLLLTTAALGAFILFFFIYDLFTTYYTESSKVVSALELKQALK